MKRGATLVVLASALAACGPDLTLEDLENTPSDYSFDKSVFADASVLGLKTDWSPANPIPTEAQVVGDEEVVGASRAFDFCFDAPPGTFDLNQAAWLAMFATNVYAHFGYFGPQLSELGFVNPSGAGLDWAQCALDHKTVEGDQRNNRDLFEAAVDLEVMRDYIDERFIQNDRWGACAKTWFAAVGDGEAPVFDGRGLPLDSFTAWLLQNPKPENYVEFGCGGEWDFDEAKFEEGSTQATALRMAADPTRGTPAVVIVSFRGTQPTKWKDVVVDLDVFKVDLETEERAEQGWGPGWGKAHRGFFNAYMSVDEMAQQMAAFILGSGEPTQIYITGHSLGGALATMLASRVLQDIEYRESTGEPALDLRGVYTFGSPRVGNETFVQRFNELAAKHGVTVGRVRNGDDLVTNIPKINYDHVGSMYHLTEAVPGSPELDSMLDVYTDMETEPANLTGSIGDHNISGYVATYDDDPASPTFNTASYEVSETGYYRRLHELLVQSREAGSPLAEHNHCP